MWFVEHWLACLNGNRWNPRCVGSTGTGVGNSGDAGKTCHRTVPASMPIQKLAELRLSNLGRGGRVITARGKGRADWVLQLEKKVSEATSS
jgi:hypothetical protein